MEAAHRRGTLVRACRNTPSCSGEKGGCADSNCSQRGKFRMGRGGRSPLGDSVSLQESRAKGGHRVGGMPPPHLGMSRY